MTDEVQDGVTARFIARAREVHGDAYTYGKAVYDHSKTKLTITCPKHGDWETTPESHIYRGRGCPTCARRRAPTMLDTPTFVAKARAIHGDKYGYERAEYKGSTTKLIVTCRDHGDWLVSPNSHISNGSGCPYCQQGPRWRAGQLARGDVDV